MHYILRHVTVDKNTTFWKSSASEIPSSRRARALEMLSGLVPLPPRVERRETTAGGPSTGFSLHANIVAPLSRAFPRLVHELCGAEGLFPHTFSYWHFEGFTSFKVGFEREYFALKVGVGIFLARWKVEFLRPSIVWSSLISVYGMFVRVYKVGVGFLSLFHTILLIGLHNSC